MGTLSIGVRARDKIRIGNNTLTVMHLIQPNIIVVSVKGRTLHITDAERVEIIPNVFVFCGLPDPRYEWQRRLAFEAPQEIKIERIRPPTRVSA